MAKKRARRRKHTGGAVLIGLISTLILVLALALVVRIGQLKSQQATAATAPVATPGTEEEPPEAAPAFAEAKAQTMEDIVGIDPIPEDALLPDETSAPNAEDTAAPEDNETDAEDPGSADDAKPANDAEAEGDSEPEDDTEEEPAFEYLPVYDFANITDKRIAITVDDCFQVENLKTISRVAYKANAKLTLFPIGQNVARKEIASVLQGCYYKLGFEIENHTWSHARIFRLSEAEMAAEIWNQSQAVSKALGVNYQEHFFRLMGGDGAQDQRTHNYLKQLGFSGIAYWTWSGSDASLEQSQDVLKPGMVYLFHTTDRDTEILKKFIPYCVSKGYKLVTLNELFDLPANETSDLSTLETQMPKPQPYTPVYHNEEKGDYSWIIVRIQERLHELGYLGDGAKSAVKNSVADGVYGESTATAISQFQADNGLPVTGVADPKTQKLLLEGPEDGVAPEEAEGADGEV